MLLIGDLLDLEPFTRQDARDAGLSGSALDRLVAGGRVVPLLRGVYIDAAVEDDLRVRARAASLVLPSGAVVARRAAAWLHGIDVRGPGEVARPLPLECAVPRGRTPMRRSLVDCWSEPLGDRDVEELGGVPVTTSLRTALDLARWRPHWLGLSAADQFAHAGLVDPAEGLQELERWRGDRWVSRARQVMRWSDPRAEAPGSPGHAFAFSSPDSSSPNLR